MKRMVAKVNTNTAAVNEEHGKLENDWADGQTEVQQRDAHTQAIRRAEAGGDGSTEQSAKNYYLRREEMHEALLSKQSLRTFKDK